MNQFMKGGKNPDDLNFDGAAYGGKGGMNTSYSSVPDSPPGSSAGMPEKAWDPTGTGGMASEMRSPGLPLLHNDAMGPSRNNSLASPIRTQSPGLPSTFPPPTSSVNRGFSASPHAPSRMGSTGPQAGGYSAPGSPQNRSPGSPAPHDMYGMARVNSPGPLLQSNRGPGSPGPQGPYNGGYRGGEGAYWNNGGQR
jgi:hypothetical protein